MSGKTVEYRPLVTEIVMGDPIRVEGRELVPLARVTSRVRRRALVGSGGVSGGGWGFVHVRPVAILDRSGTSERRICLHDETARLIIWLTVIFFIVPSVSVLLTYLSRRSSSNTS